MNKLLKIIIVFGIGISFVMGSFVMIENHFNSTKKEQVVYTDDTEIVWSDNFKPKWIDITNETNTKNSTVVYEWKWGTNTTFIGQPLYVSNEERIIERLDRIIELLETRENEPLKRFDSLDDSITNETPEICYYTKQDNGTWFYSNCEEYGESNEFRFEQLNYKYRNIDKWSFDGITCFGNYNSSQPYKEQTDFIECVKIE